jgi:hypothetical protein
MTRRQLTLVFMWVVAWAWVTVRHERPPEPRPLTDTEIRRLAACWRDPNLKLETLSADELVKLPERCERQARVGDQTRMIDAPLAEPPER